MASDFTVDRASKKYVLGSDGYLKEYLDDQPAIEFNADGSYKGVLVEPAGTNLLTRSEEFDTTWTLFDAGDTLTSGQSSPDNGTNAYLFAPDSTSGAHLIRYAYTISSGVTYTISAFIKNAGRRYVHLTFGGASLGLPSYDYRRGVFDLTDGEVYSAPTSGQATIRDYGDGWYRCTVTITPLAPSDRSNFDIYHADPTDPTNNTVTDGNGTDGVYIYGAQLEESPIATSYIPTAGSQMSRIEDDIYLTSASSLIGQTEGTIFTEVDWQDSGETQALLSANYDVDNRVALYKTTGNDLNMFVQENGSTAEYDDGVDASAYTGIQKIAFAYDDGDVELYVNGSSVKSGAPSLSGFASPLENVDFGQSVSNANQANMWIRAVALFKTRLSDTEAEELTSL